jgi:hypothetical protein
MFRRAINWLKKEIEFLQPEYSYTRCNLAGVFTVLGFFVSVSIIILENSGQGIMGFLISLCIIKAGQKK